MSSSAFIAVAAWTYRRTTGQKKKVLNRAHLKQRRKSHPCHLVYRSKQARERSPWEPSRSSVHATRAQWKRSSKIINYFKLLFCYLFPLLSCTFGLGTLILQYILQCLFELRLGFGLSSTFFCIFHFGLSNLSCLPRSLLAVHAYVAL